MNHQRFLKCLFVLGLTVALLLNGIGFNAFATDTEIFYVYETENNFDDPLIYPEAEISGDGMCFYSDSPEISEERETNWIDRIHNKPQFAVDFYDWLISNTDSDGALISGIEDYIDDNEHIYAHKVTQYVEKKEFVFTPGISEDEIVSIAIDSVKDIIEDNFYTSAEWISEVYSAFDRDHPEVFWLSGSTVVAYNTSYSVSFSTSGKGVIEFSENIFFYLSSDSFNIRSYLFSSKSEVLEAINERNAAIKNIVNSCTATTDYEIIKYINNYLTKNNCYNSYAETDYCSPLAHRCISALLGKTGVYAPVCDGYAKAFKVLCDEFNIPCVLVDGVTNGRPHMWNYAYIDGNWYAVDVTWNDPITSSKEYISGAENENYLLIGSETVVDGEKFSDSHIVHNTVIDTGISFINEPLISKATYNSTLNHTCTIKNGYCSFCNAKRYDVNRDTEVNLIDLIAMKISLLDENLNFNGDCNLNGSINSEDLVTLKKYFWDNF